MSKYAGLEICAQFDDVRDCINVYVRHEDDDGSEDGPIISIEDLALIAAAHAARTGIGGAPCNGADTVAGSLERTAGTLRSLAAVLRTSERPEDMAVALLEGLRTYRSQE